MVDVVVAGEWVWERRRLCQAREELESFSDHSWTWEITSDGSKRLQLFNLVTKISRTDGERLKP